MVNSQSESLSLYQFCLQMDSLWTVPHPRYLHHLHRCRDPRLPPEKVKLDVIEFYVHVSLFILRNYIFSGADKGFWKGGSGWLLTTKMWGVRVHALKVFFFFMKFGGPPKNGGGGAVLTPWIRPWILTMLLKCAYIILWNDFHVIWSLHFWD